MSTFQAKEKAFKLFVAQGTLREALVYVAVD
jgi:hypothetical protein